MRVTSLAKAALVLTLSSIVGLALLELGLRAYSTFFFPKMMVLDDQLGWKHAVNVRRIFVNEYGEKALVIQNAHGRRGPLREFKRRERRFRVLVLGDSFTEGVQVSEDDLFTAQLERGPRVYARRGTRTDDAPAFVVEDGNYVSARWPGDAYLFAKRFAALLDARGAPAPSLVTPAGAAG